MPQAARPVAGIAAAVLSSALVLALWPDSRTVSDDAVVVLAGGDSRLKAELAGGAPLQAAATLTEERSTRFTAAPSANAPAVTKPAPAPAPVAAVVKQLWVTTDVTVRSGPSAQQDRVGSLKALTRVGATGEAKSGYTQVVTGGRTGWVRSAYLSAAKPKPKPAAAAASASSRPVAGVSNAPCRISRDIEPNLRANARAVYRAVCAAYGGSVSSFGGYRPGDDGEHGSGRAVDIMVSGDPGKVIARYLQAHARELGVTYVIYQQKIWMAGDPVSQWKFMKDRGGRTANHYDHVHVSVR